MILHIHSDASYLSEQPMANSRAGGYYFYFSDKTDMINGAVHVVANIIQNIMSSAAEAEVAALVHCDGPQWSVPAR